MALDIGHKAFEREVQRVLLRDIFAAASGTHDD